MRLAIQESAKEEIDSIPTRSDAVSDYDASWPEFEWPSSGWFLTALGAIAALVVIIFPGVTNWSLKYRFLTAISCIAISYLLAFIKLIFHCPTTMLKRVRQYPDLLNLASRFSIENDQSKEIIRSLLRQLAGSKIVEVHKLIFDQKTLSLQATYKKSQKLEIGHTLAVVSTNGGETMGSFKVLEIKDRTCTAIAIQVDPVWLGYINKVGSRDVVMPPDTITIILTTDGDKND